MALAVVPHIVLRRAPGQQAKVLLAEVNLTVPAGEVVKHKKVNLDPAVVPAVMAEQEVNGLLEVERIMPVEEELVTILQELRIMEAVALVAEEAAVAAELVLQ